MKRLRQIALTGAIALLTLMFGASFVLSLFEQHWVCALGFGVLLLAMIGMLTLIIEMIKDDSL